MALTRAKISTVFFADITEAFSTVRREDGGEKIKGRPVAAEKTGEADIHSHNYQGT
jgi:quercetin dioxygenase-like cupin family protein